MLAKSQFFVFIVLPVFELSNGVYNVCHSYYALANRTAKQQYECKKPMKKGVECWTKNLTLLFDDHPPWLFGGHPPHCMLWNSSARRIIKAINKSTCLMDLYFGPHHLPSFFNFLMFLCRGENNTAKCYYPALQSNCWHDRCRRSCPRPLNCWTSPNRHGVGAGPSLWAMAHVGHYFIPSFMMRWLFILVQESV